MANTFFGDCCPVCQSTNVTLLLYQSVCNRCDPSPDVRPTIATPAPTRVLLGPAVGRQTQYCAYWWCDDTQWRLTEAEILRGKIISGVVYNISLGAARSEAASFQRVVGPSAGAAHVIRAYFDSDPFDHNAPALATISPNGHMTTYLPPVGAVRVEVIS